MTTPDMFKSKDDASATAKAPASGLIVTNHLNLMYMLAAGLVMPPAGFGGKYYRDVLECFPGWIPVFTNKVPKSAIESAISEATHLKPVLVEIDLTGISGGVIALDEHGPRELRYPDRLDGMGDVVLVPAPLPVSRIDSIVFQTSADRRACEADARDFGNVPLDIFTRRTHKTLFTQAPDIPWPPAEGPEERAVPLERPLAAGGVMAMLLLFGNLGDAAVRACRNAFDPVEEQRRPADDHPILAELATWMREDAAPRSAPAVAETDRVGLQNALQGTLFWEAVERLQQWRDTGRGANAETVLLKCLAAALPGLDPRAQAGIGKLHATLESLTGLADATAGELFDRHDTPLAHALTLFFLRRDCADLFDFRSDRLGETDWLAAAVLFAVRDGWLNLPLRLRCRPGLMAAASHRMAQISHRLAGSGVDLGDPPARPRPLRERFGDGTGWRSDEKAAALELARAQKWDCVNTRITLGAGEYTLTVKGVSVRIDLPGEPRISPEIDADRFLSLLASARLDPRTEAKVRAKFRG